MADRLCSLDKCDNKHYAKSLCKKHYTRAAYRAAPKAAANKKRKQRASNPLPSRAASRKWREANKEKNAAYNREWRKANKEKKATHNAARRSRVTLTPFSKAKSTARRAALKDLPCFYCERREPGNMTYDHVFPLARGGTDHWFNLVRACKTCNFSKGTRLASQFTVAR